MLFKYEYESISFSLGAGHILVPVWKLSGAYALILKKGVGGRSGRQKCFAFLCSIYTK